MNEFHEQIRDYATGADLGASDRQAYVLAYETDKAARAANEAMKQLSVLIPILEGRDGPDAALAALRTLAGHAGYSNSVMTAASEVTAAAGAVAGILSTL